MQRAGWIAKRIATMLASAFTLLPGTAIAQQQQAAPAQRYGSVAIYVGGYGRQPDAQLTRRPLPVGNMPGWVSAADYPAEALAAGRAGYGSFSVTIRADGSVGGCEVIEAKMDEGLRDVACRLVRERGRFLHALSREGKAVEATIIIGVAFHIRSTAEFPPGPPAPPAPPVGWRERPYAAGLRLAAAPDWRVFAPPGKPSGDVVVTVLAFPTRSGNPANRICSVETSSGDRALDVATCDALKAARYETIDGGGSGYSMQVLVKWREGKATHALPSRPRATPLVILNPEATTDLIVTGTERGWAEASFKPDGSIDCTIIQSVGSDAGDLEFCEQIRSKIRFTPAIDLFGRKVPATRRFRYDPPN